MTAVYTYCIWNSIILYRFPEVLLPKVRWNLKITPKQRSKRLLNQTSITLGSFAVTFQGINRGYCSPSARLALTRTSWHPSKMAWFQVVWGWWHWKYQSIGVPQIEPTHQKLGSWLVVLHTSRRNVLASRGHCKRHGNLSMTQKKWNSLAASNDFHGMPRMAGFSSAASWQRFRLGQGFQFWPIPKFCIHITI